MSNLDYPRKFERKQALFVNFVISALIIMFIISAIVAGARGHKIKKLTAEQSTNAVQEQETEAQNANVEYETDAYGSIIKDADGNPIPVAETKVTAAATLKYKIVADPCVNVRPDDSTNNDPVGTINNGETVEILELNSTKTWGKVNVDGVEGWIKLDSSIAVLVTDSNAILTTVPANEG